MNQEEKSSPVKEEKDFKEEMCYFCGNQICLESQKLLVQCGLCGETLRFEPPSENPEVDVKVEKVTCPLCKTDIFLYPTVGPISCNVCKEIIYFHSDDMTLDKPHVCSVCGKRFRTNDRMKKHAKKHSEKKFECRHCGHVFWDALERKTHENIHSQSESHKQCSATVEIKNKGYSKDQNIRVSESVIEVPNDHIQNATKVTKEKQQCAACGVESANLNMLENHICKSLRKNSVSRDYECSDCRISFMELKHLEEHACFSAKKKVQHNESESRCTVIYCCFDMDNETHKMDVETPESKNKSVKRKMIESTEETLLRRSANAEATRRRRALETSEETELRKLQQAAYVRRRRALEISKETPEETQARKLQQTADGRRRRALETPEETESRRLRQAAYKRRRRGLDTPQQARERLSADAEARRLRRWSEKAITSLAAVAESSEEAEVCKEIVRTS